MQSKKNNRKTKSFKQEKRTTSEDKFCKTYKNHHKKRKQKSMKKSTSCKK